MHIGAALRMFRLDSGWSLRALARRIGVSSAYLSRVETGRDPAPTPERLWAIAEVLELPSEVLVELAGQTGAAISGYAERVPAAGAFFLEVARRGLDAKQIARLWQLMEDEFPATAPPHARSLADIVGPRVVLDLACTDMAEVIGAGAAQCARGNTTRARRLADNLMQRESECPTYLGNGFAVPHTVVEGAPTSAALVTLAEPLECATPDGAPIEVAIVLVSGAGGRDHLEILARIARIASRDVASELRRAKTIRSALAIVRRIESA